MVILLQGDGWGALIKKEKWQKTYIRGKLLLRKKKLN